MKLDKEDLIALIRGTKPHFSIFNDSTLKKYGGSDINDGWNWNDKFEWKKESIDSLNEKELLELFNFCKKSWDGKIKLNTQKEFKNLIIQMASEKFPGYESYSFNEKYQTIDYGNAFRPSHSQTPENTKQYSIEISDLVDEVCETKI